jgi:hypothetical protein
MSGKNSQTRPTSTATANGGGGSSSSLGSSQKRRNYNEGGNDDAWSSSVAGPSSQAVNDLAAAIGPQTTTSRAGPVEFARSRWASAGFTQADAIASWPRLRSCSAIGDGRNVSAAEIAAIPVRWRFTNGLFAADEHVLL